MKIDMKKSKPILFVDFDGTICHDRYWRSLPHSYHGKVQTLLFGTDTKRVNDWMRGRYTAEEINQLVAKTMDFPYEELWELFVNDCESMEVSVDTLERLSALRDRYTVILITGNMDSFSRFTAPALNLDKYFDYISNSYYEGKHKTDNDGEIFTEYATKYGVPLNECFVIDDSKNVCATFEQLGGTAYFISLDADVNHYLGLLEAEK